MSMKNQGCNELIVREMLIAIQWLSRHRDFLHVSISTYRLAHELHLQGIEPPKLKYKEDKKDMENRANGIR